MKQKPDYFYLTSYQMKRNENLLKTGRSTSHSILAQATLRYRAACMRITKKNSFHKWSLATSVLSVNHKGQKFLKF